LNINEYSNDMVTMFWCLSYHLDRDNKISKKDLQTIKTQLATMSLTIPEMLEDIDVKLTLM